MPRTLTKEERSRFMSKVKTAGTGPEVALRRTLWRMGFRYRVNVKSLPGSPDIVLPKYRTVVFVHGCFWHGHQGCRDYVVPKTNTAFWEEKVRKNRERDEKVWRSLLAKGWEVIIVWECELSKKDRFSETMSRIAAQIRANGSIHATYIEERRRENMRHRLEALKR